MSHIHEKYDFVVTLVIVYRSKLLLVNHPRYDRWITPGGHIELDEDPEQTLYREAREETGLEIELLATKPDVEAPGMKFLPTPNYLDVHDANAPHKHIGLVYFARATSDKFVLSAEHKEMKWFSLEELQEPGYGITADIIFYARQIIKMEGK